MRNSDHAKNMNALQQQYRSRCTRRSYTIVVSVNVHVYDLYVNNEKNIKKNRAIITRPRFIERLCVFDFLTVPIGHGPATVYCYFFFFLIFISFFLLFNNVTDDCYNSYRFPRPRSTPSSQYYIIFFFPSRLFIFNYLSSIVVIVIIATDNIAKYVP